MKYYHSNIAMLIVGMVLLEDRCIYPFTEINFVWRPIISRFFYFCCPVAVHIDQLTIEKWGGRSCGL